MRFHNSIIKGTQIRLFLRKDVSLGLRKSIDKINIRSKTLVNKEKKRKSYLPNYLVKFTNKAKLYDLQLIKYAARSKEVRKNELITEKLEKYKAFFLKMYVVSSYILELH